VCQWRGRLIFGRAGIRLRQQLARRPWAPIRYRCPWRRGPAVWYKSWVVQKSAVWALAVSGVSGTVETPLFAGAVRSGVMT
jgi:hypothetical protein